jgi:hypothetical protein
MDIEGAETEAICASQKLDNVGQMFIEYHSFAGAEQTLAGLLQKLTAFRLPLLHPDPILRATAADFGGLPAWNGPAAQYLREA